MNIIAINPTLVELIVLPFVALIFGLSIYFFIRSRRTLKQTIEENNLLASAPVKKARQASAPRNTIDDLKEKFNRRVTTRETAAPALPSKLDTHTVKELKQTIAQQQQMLEAYLESVEEKEKPLKAAMQKQNEQLEEEIIKLHGVIESRDAEIEELYQQASAAKKMSSRIEEVYQEFDALQEKLQALEKQAGRANSMAIELEDTRNAYEVIHKELARKQEKLEEVMEDNHLMKEEINMLEDKLAEANLQRQQLHKKVQFLTDLNNDMQGISETNKKMQTELRRIGELESMLNMMAEERDYLLRRKLEK